MILVQFIFKDFLKPFWLVIFIQCPQERIIIGWISISIYTHCTASILRCNIWISVLTWTPSVKNLVVKYHHRMLISIIYCTLKVWSKQPGRGEVHSLQGIQSNYIMPKIFFKWFQYNVKIVLTHFWPIVSIQCSGERVKLNLKFNLIALIVLHWFLRCNMCILSWSLYLLGNAENKIPLHYVLLNLKGLRQTVWKKGGVHLSQVKVGNFIMPQMCVCVFLFILYFFMFSF